jgi:hypothetical protein
MILYKYMSFEAGRALMEGCSIGFSQPEHFNDPFDLPSYPHEDPDNELEGTFSELRTMGKNHIWAQNTGILSLTRTPTNPLMWAHYADRHRGVVVGIDATLAGLTSELSNLIPAQYGSVVYVSRRSDQPFLSRPSTGLAVGSTHHFPHDHYEKLQRILLHKSICWSYEEEVRVVKCIKGILPTGGSTPSGEFSVVDADGRPLYLFSMPSEAVLEFYFGFRSDHEMADIMYDQYAKRFPHLQFYECTLDDSNLAVGFQSYIPTAEHTQGYWSQSVTPSGPTRRGARWNHP